MFRLLWAAETLPRLQNGPGGYRVEAAKLVLPIQQGEMLDQGQEFKGARDAADCRGKMVMTNRATLVPDQPADAIQALAKTEKKVQGDFITRSKTGRGLANIKKTDIQQASWMDDVHKAASYLQDIAGIGPSHVADQYLDQTKWRDTTARIKLLQEWLTAEALHYERS